MESEKAFHALLTEPGRRLNLTARGRTFGGYFIGSKPAEYLVIELPRSSEIDEHLTEGRSVRGSFCASGEMIRFESSIIAFQKKPAWLRLFSGVEAKYHIDLGRASGTPDHSSVNQVTDFRGDAEAQPGSPISKLKPGKSETGDWIP